MRCPVLHLWVEVAPARLAGIGCCTAKLRLDYSANFNSAAHLISKLHRLQALFLRGCRVLCSQNSLDQVADHLVRHLHRAAGQGAMQIRVTWGRSRHHPVSATWCRFDSTQLQHICRASGRTQGSLAGRDCKSIHIACNLHAKDSEALYVSICSAAWSQNAVKLHTSCMQRLLGQPLN